MKKITLFLVAITMSLFSFAAQPKRIYAYDLSSALVDKVYTFSFTANETPTSGKIIFYDATSSELVGEIALTNPVLGKNEVEIAEYSLPGNDGQQLNWSVELSAAEVTAYEKVFADASHRYRRGYSNVDVSPESDHFGKVYVADRTSTKNKSKFYVYNPTYAILDANGHTLGATTWGFGRFTIASDGTVWLTDYTDGHSGLFLVDPDILTTTSQFFTGTRASSGLFKNGSVEVGSSLSCASLYGKGVNTKLVTVAEDYTGTSFPVAVFNVGKSDGTLATTWTTAPNILFNTLGNGAQIFDIKACEQGVWVATNRSNGGNSKDATSLRFYTWEGNCTWSSHEHTDLINGSLGGSLAITPDEKQIIMKIQDNTIAIFDVTWSGNTPTLTLNASFNCGYAAVSAINLDYAGNIVTIAGTAFSGTDTQRMSLVVYSNPTTKNTCEVPAKKADVVTKVEAAVTLYTITTNVNDPIMGSVSGNLGTYEDGASAELTAVANDHYEFTGWTGDVTSNENPLTITVDGNKTITANFQEHAKYTITAVPNDENMGTVTGGREYYVGESAILKATAKSGYVFAGWADGEKNATRTVTVSGDETYTANFQAIAPRAWAYDLKVVEDGDNYKFTFNATAAGSATLLFADIDGNAVAPTSHDAGPVAVGANTVLVAKASFTENKDVYWSVKMDGEAIPAISEITDQSRGIYDFYNMMGVVVDNDPNSKDFGKIYIQQSFEYTSGTTADRNKTQKAGIFIYDQGLNELNPTNVGYKPTMPTGYTAIGKSRESFKRLAINPTNGNLVFGNNISGEGSVWTIGRDNLTAEATNIIEGATGIDKVNAICYDENGTLYVLANIVTGATPYKLYKFTDGVQTELTLAGKKIFIDADVAMTSDGRGGLWIAQRRGGITQYSILSHINVAEDKVDFVLDAEGTYKDWFAGNCFRAAIAYNAAESIVAVQGASKILLFKVSYDVSTGAPSIDKYLQVSPVGTSVDGLAFDYAGDLYTVNSGSEKFQKFTLPTDENICTVPAPSSQKLVLGTQCEVTVTVNDPAMGSVEGAGQYEKGAEVILTPNPVAHHRFVNWTGDMTSTDNPLKFTIEGDVNLTANFAPIPQVTITVTSNNEDMGTVTGDGTYDEGQEVTIVATPKATYRFVKWSDDVTDATRTFPAAEDLTLQAIFEKVPNRAWAYDLSQVADGDNYKFSFVATTAGEATLLFADKDGNELVAPYAVGTVAAGANTVTLAKTTFEGVTKDVYWSVKMDGEEIAAVAEITDQAKGIYDFVDMTGVLVDNNPDSKYFGEVYVQMALNGTVGSKTQTAGLFIFDQTLAIKNTDANAGIQPILPSGYTMGDNRNKFHRLNINPNTGDLVYSYNIASSPAVFAIDRENMAGNVTNLVEGVTGLTHTNAHCFDENGTLYVMDNASYPNTGAIYKIVDGVAKQFVANANWANASITMASDGRGGLWVSQNRGQLDGFYQLTHVTSGGTIDWYVNSSSSQGLTGHSRRGALAYDVERQILAQGRDAKVELYSVEYDATTGVPTLTSLYTVADAANIGNDIDGLAFDYAGDLYVVNTTKKKFQKFTIPTDENICTVPAPSSQKLVLGTQCEVTVTVNDPAMGSVEGAGIYEKGTEVTLTPNPVAHHRFVNWTGDMTSTDNPLKFTIEGDVNLTANFEAIPTYTITTSVNDSDMGTVTAGGTYYEDTEVTLTATANAGYVFVQWNDGVTEETRTFTAGVDMPETLTANFKVAVPRAWAYDLRLDSVADPANYTFTFTATSAGNATIFFTDEEGTSVAPTQEVVGTVAAGETKTVTIAKSAFTGDKDIYWSVKVEGEAIAKMAELTDPNRKIYDFYSTLGVVVDNNPESEYFGKIYVQATLNGASDGKTLRAQKQKAGLFIYDQKLDELNPTTNDGIQPSLPSGYSIGGTYQFNRLAIDPTTNNITYCYAVKNQPAVFSMDRANLTGTPTNLLAVQTGITRSVAHCFDQEGNLYVMDLPGSGQIFKIEKNGTKSAFGELTTKYVQVNTSLASDGRGGLWVSQNRGQIDAYYQLVHYNASGTVDFAVYQGNENGFTGGSYRGALAYDIERQILAQGRDGAVELFNVVYDAETSVPTLTKFATTPTLSGANIDGLAFDYAGDLYMVNSGTERFYKYVLPTNTNTCTVPAPESQCIQKEKRYTVTVVANPAEGGIVSGGGDYPASAKVEVKATANIGYQFVNWTKDAVVVSTSASFDYTVSAEDVTLTANFAPLPEITYELNGGVWNAYGWTSKKDMYNALLDDWRAYSGSTRTNVSYEEQLGIGNSSKGIPTTIAEVDHRVALMDLFTDATYAPKWGWLANYVDAVAATQYKKMDAANGAKTQPTSGAGVLTYTIGNFFGEDNVHSADYIDAVDFTGVEAHITAFAPYWGQTFPLPTQPTEEVVLNAPYREGYEFDGWYTSSDFSGAEITVVDENTDGTLYAKWIESVITVTIDDGPNNTAALAPHDGETVTVKVNRNFGEDKILTLTLPFDMSATQISTYFGNATVYEFYNVVDAGEELHLQFYRTTSIEAGKPYILQTTSGYDATDGFTIEGVTITTALSPVEIDGITMVPVLDGDGELNQSTEYYLSNNALYCAGTYPQLLLGLRAYFTSPSPTPIRARVVFGENEATSIPMVTTPETKAQKIIQNGRLIIIRGEHQYNAQGQIIE